MARRGPRARRVVADGGFRLFNIAVLAFGALVTLAGMYDPQRTSDSARAPGWAILVFLGVLAVRSTRLGLVVGDEHVIIRSWFSTRRVPRRRVVDVSTTAYSGGWNLNGSSGAFKMVRLELLRGGYRDVPAVAGRPDRLRALALRASRQLGLPAAPMPSPRTHGRRPVPVPRRRTHHRARTASD